MLFFKCLMFCVILISKAWSQVCFCDLTQGDCDVNCCCDPNCSNNIVVFSYCINTNTNTSNLQCAYAVDNFVNGTLVSTVVQQTGLFCLIQDNFPTRNYFVDSACIAINTCTDAPAYTFSDSSATQPTMPEYQTGDPIFVVFSGSSNSGLLTMPSSGVSSVCQNYAPVNFLVSRNDACTRFLSINNMMSACSSFLNFTSYWDGIKIYSFPSNTSSTVNISVSRCVVNGIAENCSASNFVNNSCEFAVTSISYVFDVDSNYNRIVSASVSFVLQNIFARSEFFLTQAFAVSFQVNNQAVVNKAGNPGYIVGKPLLAAVRQTNLENIIQSSVLGLELTLINSLEDGTCESAQLQNRLPLLFGQDITTGCTLPITGTCSELNNQIKKILDGPILDAFNGSSNIFVGTFGNSNISNLIAAIPADWVEVLIDTDNTQSVNEPSGCRNLLLSSKYEILYANGGAISNPQAKIVGVRYSYDISPFFRFTCLNGACNQTVDIFTSVNFIDVSSNPVSIERIRPTIDARLPADFFYPFRN